MSPHWKHRATRCAVVDCERQRVRGWSTCALIAHYRLGKPLAGAGRIAPIISTGTGDKMNRHAVFATAPNGVTFRIGQPTDWHGAQDRWVRLTNGRSRRLRHARRWYPLPRVRFEVRATDRHGRGLGAERHERAIPVPYRAVRVV